MSTTSCTDIITDNNYALINKVIEIKNNSTNNINDNEKELMAKLIEIFDNVIKTCKSTNNNSKVVIHTVNQFNDIKEKVNLIISKLENDIYEHNMTTNLDDLENNLNVDSQHLSNNSKCPTWQDIVIERSSLLFDKKKIEKLLKQIKDFSQFLSKHEKYIINSLESYFKNNKDKKNPRYDTSDKINSLLDEYTQINFDFLAKRIRRNLQYLDKWKNDKNLNEHLSPYRNEINQVENNLKSLRSKVSQFLTDTFPKTLHEYIKDKNFFGEMNKNILKTKQTITEYYNSITIGDIIVDKEFIFTYFLKFLNICAFTAALYFSEVIFSKLYFREKYVNLKGQPNILYLILLVISFIIGFFIFILLLILTIKFIIQTYNKDIFFINDHLFSSYIIDCCLTLVLFSTLAIVISYFMQHKRYFRYKIEGLYTLEGLKDMLLHLSVFINILPVFFVNW